MTRTCERRDCNGEALHGRAWCAACAERYTLPALPVRPPNPALLPAPDMKLVELCEVLSERTERERWPK